MASSIRPERVSYYKHASVRYTKTKLALSEVRRVVLFNLELNAATIPRILERARDVDAINRRVVYLKPMAELEDFRLIDMKQRHQLLKWGLNDRYIRTPLFFVVSSDTAFLLSRDPLVRRAAGKLVSTQWIRHADYNLLEFLERMDVVEGEAAEDILIAILTARMDIVSLIKFEGNEAAFMKTRHS